MSEILCWIAQNRQDPRFDEWFGREVQGMLADDECGANDFGRAIIDAYVNGSVEDMFHAFTAFPMDDMICRLQDYKEYMKEEDERFQNAACTL